jgi:hypothetical protein
MIASENCQGIISHPLHSPTPELGAFSALAGLSFYGSHRDNDQRR